MANDILLLTTSSYPDRIMVVLCMCVGVWGCVERAGRKGFVQREREKRES